MTSFAIQQISNDVPVDNGNLFLNRFGNAAINDTGTITYEGFQGFCNATGSGSGANCLQTGTNTPPSAIFTSNSYGSPTPNVVVDKSINDSFNNNFQGYDSGVFFSASTNDAGTTVLSSSGYNLSQLQAGGPSAVLTRTDNGPVNTVANTSTPFGITLLNPTLAPPALYATSNLAAAGDFTNVASINNAGTVAYFTGSNGTVSFDTKNSNGQVSTIANTGNSSNFKDFYTGGVTVARGQGPFAAYTIPSINDKGDTAFNADLKSGGRGLFKVSNGQLTTIADTTSGKFTKFSVASLNASGDAAFDGGLADGGSAVYIDKGGQLTTIVNTSGGYFQDLTQSDVAINQQDNVAFLANLNDGGRAIFTGSSSGLNKVISVGDKIGDYTVADLFISRGGLNNQGQVAFDASLVDGNGNVTQQVFVADPQGVAVPEPNSSFALLGVAVLGVARQSWQRRTKSTKRVQL
ncbi:MAG: PEP-CTERM sorting domain-containing protein [Chroococcidiopsidaceae cyanobacterium CP_BM_RX_35]|nr:PEP-CTERM sorting domain-containing protein [Chroococcidiopsidaceae cyanobacterium CP_BM_RX_35]